MDPSAFFTLHDYDNSAAWTEQTYGVPSLDDESTKDMAEDKRTECSEGRARFVRYEGQGPLEELRWRHCVPPGGEASR